MSQLINTTLAYASASIRLTELDSRTNDECSQHWTSLQTLLEGDALLFVNQICEVLGDLAHALRPVTRSTDLAAALVERGWTGDRGFAGWPPLGNADIDRALMDGLLPGFPPRASAADQRRPLRLAARLDVPDSPQNSSKLASPGGARYDAALRSAVVDYMVASVRMRDFGPTRDEDYATTAARVEGWAAPAGLIDLVQVVVDRVVDFDCVLGRITGTSDLSAAIIEHGHQRAWNRGPAIVSKDDIYLALADALVPGHTIARVIPIGDR